MSLTGGNRNDVTQLLPLLAKGPSVADLVGRPRRRPDVVLGDRGYDHDKYRRLVWALGIKPVIARRGVPHGSGLGAHRWVVERTIARLHGFRRLRIRWERRDDIREAFLGLATCLITHRHVRRLCQDLLSSCAVGEASPAQKNRPIVTVLLRGNHQDLAGHWRLSHAQARITLAAAIQACVRVRRHEIRLIMALSINNKVVLWAAGIAAAAALAAGGAEVLSDAGSTCSGPVQARGDGDGEQTQEVQIACE
ncbi:transposase [Streptomyces sp. MJP52]|nr:transposase [Streptomyces sp. MJP52]